ncbi:hypothetical protein E6C70_10340 [Glaciibacter flavus]|uniref:Uncharacterized protein n=1 Tax=Orlajensenia flava TaxID=2565934 RepID=A0A4S4FSV9_9MICO|nr:hypothetical protein [Glaciibacter flavus]THG33840.1 hypothetical protein E6C70_10340 [Glaciibacter flavus]
MADLLRPLGRRRVWVLFGAGVIIALTITIGGGLGHNARGVHIVSDVLMVVAIGAIGSGIVTALTTLEPDCRVAALEAVDRQRQRSVRHAVRSGEMGRVATEDRATTIDNARAVAASLPGAVSASVMGSI